MLTRRRASLQYSAWPPAPATGTGGRPEGCPRFPSIPAPGRSSVHGGWARVTGAASVANEPAGGAECADAAAGAADGYSRCRPNAGPSQLRTGDNCQRGGSGSSMGAA